MNCHHHCHGFAVRPLLTLAAVASLIGGIVLGFALRDNPHSTLAADRSGTSYVATSDTRASVLMPPRPMPDLALVDQAGLPFARSNLAGRWSLLFFGFTHCPDICPTTLYELKTMRQKLADLPAELRPNVIFVSVDPERDTPEKLAEYLEYFQMGAQGVTGSREAIAELCEKLGVAVAYPEDDSAAGYTVSHTGALFAVNPDAALAAIFVPPHDIAALVADWRVIVAGSGG